MGLSVLIASAMTVGFVPHSSPAAQTTFVWSQFGFDDQHSGSNPLETHITSANVHSLHRLYQVPLVSKSTPSVADGAPAFLGGVEANGPKDLLFLTTKDGWTLALDAHTGKQLWGKQYGPNGCMINHDTARHETCYTTSSPAIDPNRQFVYSYGLDGYVHKYQVATGEESTGLTLAGTCHAETVQRKGVLSAQYRDRPARQQLSLCRDFRLSRGCR